MVIIGISKGRGGGALTCGNLPRSRCCDVYRRGCIPLFFPQCPLNFVDIGQIPEYIVKLVDNVLKVYPVMKSLVFVILEKSFVKLFFKLSNLIPIRKYLLDLKANY